MRSLPILLLLAATGPACSPEDTFDASAPLPGVSYTAADVLGWLPRAGATVEVQHVGITPRLLALMEKFRAAVAENTAWMQQQIAAAAPGEPIPYDRRLGLTESEYEEVLAFAPNEMSLLPGGESELVVTDLGAGRFALEPDAELPGFADVVLDLGRGVVETPFGETTELSESHHSEAAGLLGAWDGLTWNLQRMSLADPAVEGGAPAMGGTSFSLAMGRLRDRETTFLYLNLISTGGDAQARWRHVVFHDLRD